MSQIDQSAGMVLARAKAGDIPGAIALGEEALAAGRGDAGLAMFVGMLCCRQGELERGIVHLRKAVDRAPGEPSAKVELARALLSAGAFGEAEIVAAPLASMESMAGREMQRIYAHALLRDARAEEAVILFAQLTEADARDFESWDGLGASRLALGDGEGAVAALGRATQLRPTAVAYWINLSRAYVAARDFDAAIDAAGRAVARAPQDAAAQLELGRALAGADRHDEALLRLSAALAAAPDNIELASEAADVMVTCKAFAQAEAQYRIILARQPGLKQAWTGLGKLLERLNRPTELLALLDDAARAGIPDEELALLRARGLRGEDRLEEALEQAQAAPDYVDSAARAQLIGDIADRLGLTDAAFAAFSEANALLAADAVGSTQQAEQYRATFDRMRKLLTAEWFATWLPRSTPSPRAAPVFIFGFPRSGTTLIDTMLGGHPDTIVLEEEAVIDTVAKTLGSQERLATLSQSEIDTLRALYFAEVDAIAPGAAGKTIIDKSPLGLGNTALLYRLFPDARFVFAERHPCDVVLSCFITSAQMDAKVANFFDFVGTAMLYDSVLAYWQRCNEVLPIHVHAVRYERLVADPERELRTLAEFAGLSWNAQVLENRSNASARAYIGSPSYAQVAEPIYTRARGRWLKYRAQMQAVLPILAPWAARMGYDLGE